MGNVLVGVKRPEDNTLLWSWHIWLTDYDPDPESPTGISLEVADGWFMYRNLGALSGDQLLNDHTTGLYYQWGRKDPLRPKDISQNKSSPTLNNLIHAINAPDKFFAGGNSGDWYTSSGLREYQNDFLWTEYDNHKSQYDPCPDGWRVPNVIHGQAVTTTLWSQVTRTGQLWEYDDYIQGVFMESRSNPAQRMFLPAGGNYNTTGAREYYRQRSTNFNANASPNENTRQMALHATQSLTGGLGEQIINRACALPVRCIKRKP